MRFLTAMTYVALATFLLSCDQPQTVPKIDPKLGLECFQNQRGSLPPGTQYEGIEKLADNRLTIKIMNGVDVVTIDCAMQPDESLPSTKK